MAVLQTAINAKPPIGMEGEMAQGFWDSQIETVICGADGIKPGRFVNVLNTGGTRHTGVLPDSSGDVTGVLGKGVVLLDPAKSNNADGTYTYKVGEAMPVMRRGVVWVRPENAVTAAPSAAFVRFVAAGLEELGAFRTDADTSDAVAHPNAQFYDVASAGALCRLMIKG